MQINKKVVSNGQSLEMKASERIATYIQDNVLSMGEGTTSIKVVNKIMKGSQVSDSHLEFIMRILGQLRSEGNGSFSVSLPSSLSKEQTEQLAKAVANVHGQLEHVLNEVYQLLPEDQKSRGKEIQRQNAIRQLMMGKLSNVANAHDRVENWLKANNLLVIPSGAYMELKIVGGSLVFEQPTGQFWREGPEVVVNKVKVPTWKANWDLFGRTRLPLINEETSELALRSVFGLAKSFEDFWSGKTITSSQMILDGFLEWSETLSAKDTTIQRNALSEEEMNELDKTAQNYVSQMMEW
jgi:hypothetical protein